LPILIVIILFLAYNAIGHWGKLSRLNKLSRESDILSGLGRTVRAPTWLAPGKFAADGH